MTEPEASQSGIPGAANPPAAAGHEHALSRRWALLPVLSAGFISWGPFLYAANRTGARKYKVLTAVYLALTVLMVVLLAASNGKGGVGAIGGFFIFGLAGGGAVHTLAIRDEVDRQLGIVDDPKLLAAQQQIDQRHRALEIVKQDPKHALELGIGRPDVPGSFDAGLIDINHVGPKVLQTLPGIDDEKAKKIVELRMNGSGFTSADDLDMVLDLDPGTLAELSRRAVFLPRF